MVDTIRVGSNPVRGDLLPRLHLRLRVLQQRLLNCVPGEAVRSDDWAVATIPVGSGPQGLAFSPATGRGLRPNVSSGSVSGWRTLERHLGGAIATGDGAVDVAIAPSGLFGYATNDNARSVTRFGMSTALWR